MQTVAAYGIYISQLIQLKRYARACRLYSDFFESHHLLNGKLLSKGF
jgi:hypothetical protein